MTPSPTLLGFLSLLVFTCTGFSPLYAQFSWKALMETGVMNTNYYGNVTTNNLTFGFDGSIDYDYEDDESVSNIELRIRPEYFPVENLLHSFKYRISGNYKQNWESVSTKGTFSAQRNFLNVDEETMLYDAFIFKGDVDFNDEGYTFFSLSPGYVNQKISADSKRIMDVTFVDVLWQHIINEQYFFDYGCYIEKFRIKSEESLPNRNILLSNTGYRYGGHISIQTSAKYMFNLNYRLLLHQSDIIEKYSLEHTVRFLAGTLLSENISIFVLLDLYITPLKIKKNISNILAYYPFDSENKINLKLAYDLEDRKELFLRLGYQNENVRTYDQSFNNWNIFMGIKVSG